MIEIDETQCAYHNEEDDSLICDYDMFDELNDRYDEEMY